MDGTLIEAWASLKSFRLKQDSTSGRRMTVAILRWTFIASSAAMRRTNALTMRTRGWRATEMAKNPSFYYSGNVMIENRHGMVVGAELLQANGTAERDAAPLMAYGSPGIIASRALETRRMTRADLWPRCAR